MVIVTTMDSVIVVIGFCIAIGIMTCISVAQISDAICREDDFYND